MAKLVIAVALTGLGMFFWRNTQGLPQDMESFAVAIIFWVVALFLVLAFLLDTSTRGPWR